MTQMIEMRQWQIGKMISARIGRDDLRLISGGVRIHSEDSECTFWLMTKSVPEVDADFDDVCDRLGIAEYHGGAGQAYARRPTMRQNKYHVLVKQFSGLDV